MPMAIVVASLFVVLAGGEAGTLSPDLSPRSAGDVVGRVTDAKGAPLGGVLLVIEGTAHRGVSEPDGTFRIAAVRDGEYAIRVRKIGYAARTEALQVAGATATLNIVLQQTPTQLEEVVVTGNLSRTEAKSVPGAVSIITQDEIDARGLIKVEDIFKTVPGMAVLSNGQSNYYGSVTIRGGNRISGDNTTKILIDGVEVADDELQLNDIDPASIERVEIFRGPQASTIYGSAASGGLIQIITRKGEFTNRTSPRVEARISAGYIQTTNTYGSGAGATDNSVTVTGGGAASSYRIGGGFKTQGNWIPNGRESSPHLFGSLRTIQGPLLLEANVRYLTRDFGWLYNPAFEAVAPSIFEGSNRARETNVTRTQSYNLRAMYQASSRWVHDLTLGFEQTGADYWSTEPRDSLGTQYISINTWAQPSAKYRLGFDWKPSTAISSSLIVGADYSARTARFFSWEGIGDPTAGSIPRGGNLFVQSRYLHSTALYAEEVIGVADNLFFTLGLRADRQLATTIPVDFAWSPRAGVAYTRVLGDVTTRLRTSFGTVPSSIPSNVLLDLVLRREIYRGNPNLRPPVLRGTDIGLDVYLGRRASFTATYFNQRPSDHIDRVVTHADSAGFRVSIWQNVGEIHNRGWEFESRLFLGPLTLIGTYSPLDGKVTKLSPDYRGDLIVGAGLVNVPEWTASLTASMSLPKTTILISAAPTGSHLNRDWTKLYSSFEDGTHNPTQIRQLYVREYPGYTKFSLSVSREISQRFQGFLSVQDLLNSGAIETSDDTINKSRVTRFGLRIRP